MFTCPNCGFVASESKGCTCPKCGLLSHDNVAAYFRAAPAEVQPTMAELRTSIEAIRVRAEERAAKRFYRGDVLKNQKVDGKKGEN